MLLGEVLKEKEAEVKSWWSSTTHVAIAGKLSGMNGWPLRVLGLEPLKLCRLEFFIPSLA